MLHSAVFVDLWALGLIMPGFLCIRPSWLIDFGVQIAADLQSFCCTSGSYRVYLSSPIWILISNKRRAHDSYSFTWEIGSWLSLICLNVVGFSWNLWEQNYLWQLYHQSNLAAMTNGLKNYCGPWREWVKPSYAASEPWGSAVFSSALPQAREAFWIIADHDSSNASSQGSSSSFSADMFVKAWVFQSSMLWSWPLAGVLMQF